jgi:CRP-like cAMP-binding protein
VAGANKTLKAGTVVFKAGDNADGMYLVRKGELIVYLEQGGKEVTLAKIPEGSMVGEMALFDRMPRSASVKASVDTEITHISLDDFGKLMKQIPKWFVGLMSALSARLRTTNDRLKALEAASGGAAVAAPVAPNSSLDSPFKNTIRMLHILELLWHRDGTKEGKDWMILRKTAEDELVKIFGESPAKVSTLLEVLCSEGVLLAKQDSYKNNTLSMPNRASLRQFGIFLTGFVNSGTPIKALTDGPLLILKSLSRIASKEPYDQFTSSLEEIMEDGKVAGFNTGSWPEMIKKFTMFGDAAKPVKTSSKSGIGIRVIKTDLAAMSKNLSVLNKMAEKKLDQ